VTGDARSVALAAAQGASAALAASRERINDLNVYPVPDGDTGDNMAETARALAAGIEGSDAGSPAELARAATRATLMGARGNSGIILSQIVRGLAEELGRHERVDAGVLAAALRSACDVAYRAVRQPVEGTMLTAIRAMADGARAAAGEPLDRQLDAIVAAGERAVEETPRLLAVLREAGVVDAGAAGLTELARGAVAGLRGERPPAPAAALDRPLGAEAVHLEESRFRYCTSLLVEGEAVDAPALERRLEALGDCLLVVGVPPQLKVHIHTDDPGAVLSAAVVVGGIDGVEVADMHRQRRAREERLTGEGAAPGRPGLTVLPGGAAAAAALVAVVAGDGNARLFADEAGAEVVRGGQTMNPSTADILDAVRRAGAPAALILPNNGNVIMAAERAAEEAAAEGIRAAVVPTRSIVAGLSVAIGFDPSAGLDENVAELERLLAAVRWGELTRAVRAATVDGCRVDAGEYLGLAEGRLVASGADARDVADRLLEALLGDGGEVVTLIRGELDAFPVEEWSQALEGRGDGIEIEVHVGGQPHYPLLIAVE
jgi:DAK2 domain fusion protein YloV